MQARKRTAAAGKGSAPSEADAPVDATADLPPTRILNCVPSMNVENDWSTDAAVEADLLRAVRYPDEYDLRETWWSIGDQGQTGSCVGWATADSVLRWHFVKAGRIDPGEALSVRFVWVSAKETDQFTQRPTTFIEQAGTSLKAALDVARKLGVVKSDLLPLGRDQVYAGSEAGFYATAARLKIASYINLGRDLTAWRLWLYQNGPILTRLNVDRTFHDATLTQGNLDVYDASSSSGGHAVALVGYTAQGFIVRNSWSASWGDGGFAYATDAYAAQAFTEAYGVLV